MVALERRTCPLRPVGEHSLARRAQIAICSDALQLLPTRLVTSGTPASDCWRSRWIGRATSAPTEAQHGVGNMSHHACRIMSSTKTLRAFVSSEDMKTRSSCLRVFVSSWRVSSGSSSDSARLLLIPLTAPTRLVCSLRSNSLFLCTLCYLAWC